MIFVFQEKIKKKKATVLYDYNPREDSPYNDPDKEIHLVQGQVVSIVRSERSDGFCKVKVFLTLIKMHEKILLWSGIWIMLKNI